MQPKKNVTHHVQHGKKRSLKGKMQSERFLENLKNHVPEEAVPLIWNLIKDFDFTLTVTNERKTKHGDYRMPLRSGESHKISVNGTLNRYAFLLTYIHEIAHMHTFELYGRRVSPHGKEWKRTFRNITKPFLQGDIWPKDVKQALKSYFVNPKASSAGDVNLTRVLRLYDETNDIHLEDLKEGDVFSMDKKFDRFFIKGVKRRTRFLCTEKESSKEYTIHSLAKVYLKSKNEFE